MRHDRIEVNPLVMTGKPVIRGTRVTVEKILRELGNGLSYDQILAEYPRLTRQDIHAAQAFAADHMRDWVSAYDNLTTDHDGAVPG